ncbi:hypothetical protein JI739_10350 [Ramlibacter sp. AW1]|uniref:3-deoxy-D-arabino-heptulosonate 7-phosphate synthase n=1 Tax=Ramlibacter aurantiacus TaxID=2801330 RepID=A0A936ZFW5_9BURK|nr:hypothetical protein [Ramlibacter aurantiacus]MBL0420744.1 hypothetical protein [Ramlibacter aurantiacus]
MNPPGLGRLLRQAIAAAPRRFRWPPLPADAQAAWQAGADVAMAFALETARLARQAGKPVPEAGRALFIRSLALLVRQALVEGTGDPAFQALVLRSQEPRVDEFVRLSSQRVADRRAVRSAVNALAHPGKLRGLPPQPWHEALARLHDFAAAQAWGELRMALEQMLARADPPESALPDPLRALLDQPSLQRLEQADRLRDLPGVQRYLALCAQRGPLAGSAAASAMGRASARTGNGAEKATVDVLRTLAERLAPLGGPRLRVGRGLRTPAALERLDKSKDEWDAALLQGDEVVLLAEVKASPAAAVPDLPRLLRGLERLAAADAGGLYTFPSADGPVTLAGASLRQLVPRGRELPPHVVYFCSPPGPPQPVPWLAASTRAVLLSEPHSLAFARALAAGTPPAPDSLAPVWDALLHAPRLRAALHQGLTATTVGDATLHPRDLLDAVLREWGNSHC